MKSKLHTLLAVATALGTGLSVAQDQPKPDQQKPDPQRRLEGDQQRRPDGDQQRRPGGDPQRRPEGDQQRRPDGDQQRRLDEPRRDGPQQNQPPVDGPRRQIQIQKDQYGPVIRGQGEGFHLQRGPVPQKPTPFLGIVTVKAQPALSAQVGLPEGFGLVVEDVVGDGPAKAAGIQKLDVIKLLDDQKLTDPAQLAALVRAAGKDSNVTLTVVRKGQEQKIVVKVAEKMLPDRRTGDIQSPGIEIRGESGDVRGPIQERVKDVQVRVLGVQENIRDFQERVKEFQEKMQQWSKNPSEKMPEFPKLDGISIIQHQPGPLPAEVLREVMPGGQRQVVIVQGDGMKKWDTASAHIMMKDDSGAIEMRTIDGKRTLTAKSPDGAVIFDGPIDTEEQRRALPEALRQRLEKIEVRTRVEHREPGQDEPARVRGGAEESGNAEIQ